MSNTLSKTDAELFAELVQQYAANYRHPEQPPFTIRHHDLDSIHDSTRYPEVSRTGVYAHYDHDGTLYYIGESRDPSGRTWTHQKEARVTNRRPPPRIDLITVPEVWERLSLEDFLQRKVPDYPGRWKAWAEREDRLAER